MRAELGTLPDGFTRYILDSSRFPKLLIHCYEIASQHDLIDVKGKLLVKTKMFKPHTVGNCNSKKNYQQETSSTLKDKPVRRWFSSVDQWVQPSRANNSTPSRKAKRKGKGSGRQKSIKDKRAKTRLCQKWEDSGGMVS